jgi:acyl-[acyl-carrier-protein]-phospholipid O-acyltransferase/long-chain-fatty-acid--[acyl-carrier-protein] ligase
VVAAVNILNAALMVAGSLSVSILQQAGVGTPALFVALGAANLAVAFLLARTIPAHGESERASTFPTS